MRIFLTDLASYNEGHLIGEWLDLPSNDIEGDIRRVLAKGESISNEVHEEYFITDWECDYKDIGEYEDIYKLNELAEKLDSIDTDTLNKIEALKAYHGESYYNNIDDAIEAIDNSIGMIIEGVESDYQLAKKLEYEIGYEEELYRILGCTPEAYEQLSGYINTDDIVHTIDTEFNFAYVNNTAYEIYS